MIIIVVIILILWLMIEPRVTGGQSEVRKYYTLIHRTGSHNLSAFEFNNIENGLRGWTVKQSRDQMMCMPKNNATPGTLFQPSCPRIPPGPNIRVTSDVQEWSKGEDRVLLIRYWTRICHPQFTVRFNNIELAEWLLLMSQTFPGCTPTAVVRYGEFTGQLPVLPKSHTFIPGEWVKYRDKTWYACVKYNGVSCYLLGKYLIHVDSGTPCLWHGSPIPDGIVLYGELMPDGSFYILDAPSINDVWINRRRAVEGLVSGQLRNGWYAAEPISGFRQGVELVTAYVIESGIDSDGTIFVMNELPAQTLTLKWKHYQHLTVDVTADFDTGELWARDKNQCVKLDPIKVEGLDAIRPPGSRIGVTEFVPGHDGVWRASRLRTDKDTPNAILTVRIIAGYAKQKTDIAVTEAAIARLVH